MRLVSPYTLCLAVLIWTVVFMIASRYFLFSAHQTWFRDEEQRLLTEVETKIDNLDARNLRQLNQLYGELKTMEDILVEIRREIKVNYSHFKPQPPPVAVPSPAEIQVQKRNVEEAATLEPSIAVLVIACNRENYIRQTLDNLLKYRTSAGLFPIIVSQDCGHEPTAKAIDSYGNRVTHIKQPDLSEPVIDKEDRKMKNKKAEVGYFKISRHYRWALTQVFEVMKYHYVIIVEDDLLVAPDFFSYFASLRFLLDTDPTVWCVSAWNDNGKNGYIRMRENDVLYRTDFFPGLGWMLSKNLWAELKPKWPLKFWDDWMREPEQRNDRACIRPEVSRTKTIGKVGTSTGQYYNQHLQYIVLNGDNIDFSLKNLTYLRQDVYDQEFVARVHNLPTEDVNAAVRSTGNTEVQVKYSSKKDFELKAKKFKIMSDVRGGVPRTAYKGIVSFMYKGKRVHLVPSPWTGYPIT